MALLVLLLLMLTGCEQRPLGTSVSSDDAAWEIVYSFDYARRLTAVWSAGRGNVYVGYGQMESYGDFIVLVLVFSRGAVYHFDGAAWIDMGFPFTEYSEDVDIWGTGPDNVYVADGRLQRFDGAKWIEEPVRAAVVFGTSSDDVYAADYRNIYHYDGINWDVFYNFETPSTPVAMWVSVGPSIFVARYPGVAQFLGNEWQEVSLPMVVNDVWGSGPDDVYAFGGKSYYDEQAEIWHFDGNNWSEVNMIECEVLNCAWGSNMNDIFAAGERGAILHYDGVAWSKEQKVSQRTFYDISGSGPDGIYAVGSGQKVLHFDGGQWVSVGNDYPTKVTEIWAESPERLAVVENSGFVYILEDDKWRETYLEPSGYITDLWGFAIDDLFAVTSAGRIHRFDGNSWAVEVDSLGGRPLAVHGSGPYDIHVVGDGVIYHFDGSDWTEMLNNSEFCLNAVWATDPQNAFAVGTYGVVMHFDGIRWSRMTSGVTEDLTDVWGACSNDVYAVGRPGMIHYDGYKWTRQPVYQGDRLRWILGRTGDDIVAIGDWWRYSAFQLHYDGELWNLEETNLQTLDAIIANDGTMLQTTREMAIYQRLY